MIKVMTNVIEYIFFKKIRIAIAFTVKSFFLKKVKAE